MKERKQSHVHQKVSHAFPPAKPKCQAQAISCPPNLWLTRDSSRRAQKTANVTQRTMKHKCLSILDKRRKRDVDQPGSMVLGVISKKSQVLGCNFSTCEIQAGGLWVQASIGYIVRPLPNKQTNKQQRGEPLQKHSTALWFNNHRVYMYRNEHG